MKATMFQVQFKRLKIFQKSILPMWVKYIFPICFILLAILYAGSKPKGLKRISVDSGQWSDGTPVVVESRDSNSKQVYVMGEWDNYPLARVHSYVYDDWNLVLETITYDDNQTQEIQYFWGNDLSGTLNGAGGVGGLVAVSIDGYYYIPTCDNNGNILSYINEQGQIVASYKYDAFGNTLSQTGIMSNIFKHRFSTKYYDEELPLYYYGYRFYSPQFGRWLNRDPIEEDGGLNLYLFCLNSPHKSSTYDKSEKNQGGVFPL